MKTSSKATKNYRDDLLLRLKDDDYAAGYLTACLEDEAETFLVGLRDVVDANGGIGSLAFKTGLNREHLFRMLSKAGNPRLESLHVLLKALGLKVAFAKD